MFVVSHAVIAAEYHGQSLRCSVLLLQRYFGAGMFRHV
jgi:hypothetical protein